MKRQKYGYRFLAGCLAVVLGFVLGTGITGFPVYAASGNIYSCKITPCYQHPVTGVIEDSGGSASYATGQGMVEGAVYTTGMLEVTDSGEYYLTVRMSLVDYTSDHSFTVQNVGDSGWSSTAMGITGTGSDSNGTTADVCIQVPSENCVVRGSMYVTPMGRNVIFYFYPSNYAAGTVDGMNATMVTETAASAADAVDQAEEAGSIETTAQADTGALAVETVEEPEGNGLVSETGSNEAPALESSITQAAPAVTTGDAELDKTRGLTLSTEPEQAADTAGGTETNATGQIVTLTVAITVSGLILIGAAALTVYYFRKNWNRWGGADDEDDEDE